MLAGGAFGLYRLHGNRFSKLPVQFKTVSWAQGIASDGKGHTFLGTDAGLMELDPETGRDGFSVRVLPQPATTSAASGPNVEAVLVDGDVLWYGCGRQLCRKDASGTRILGTESGLPDTALMVIRKDGLGNIWVRTKTVGVFELPAGQTQFRRPDAVCERRCGRDSGSGCQRADSAAVARWADDFRRKDLAEDRPVSRIAGSGVFGFRGPATFVVDWIGGTRTSAVARIFGVEELFDGERAGQRHCV